MGLEFIGAKKPKAFSLSLSSSPLTKDGDF